MECNSWQSDNGYGGNQSREYIYHLNIAGEQVPYSIKIENKLNNTFTVYVNINLTASHVSNKEMLMQNSCS